MTAINITAVNVLDNPTLFVNPFQFEIQYECLQDLQHGEGQKHNQEDPYPPRVACKRCCCVCDCIWAVPDAFQAHLWGIWSPLT